MNENIIHRLRETLGWENITISEAAFLAHVERELYSPIQQAMPEPDARTFLAFYRQNPGLVVGHLEIQDSTGVNTKQEYQETVCDTRRSNGVCPGCGNTHCTEYDGTQTGVSVVCHTCGYRFREGW